MMQRPWTLLPIVALLLVACGGGSSNGDSPSGGGRPGSRGGPGGMGMMGGAPPQPVAAVPVRVATVERRPIAGYLETNGTLEAENEVDLVARTTGPITELSVEEGQSVDRDQLLARIDDREARNQVATATVTRDEARRAFERARTTFDSGLVSQEAYDAALASLQAAEAQLEKAELQLTYTEIRAPFAGLVAIRYIRLAEHVNAGSPLFRLSDFTPLLCPIQIPEKDLRKVAVGQLARIRVEGYPDELFDARVARLRPTVDAATGTITVTLEVDGRGRLRPGMFASVGVRTEVRDDALVIPSEALVLDSLGDTVFVRSGDSAARREVKLGLSADGMVEIVAGLEAGEQVVVLGQDGLADGTPITVLDADAAGVGVEHARSRAARGPETGPPAAQGSHSSDTTDGETEEAPSDRDSRRESPAGATGDRGGAAGGPGGPGMGRGPGGGPGMAPGGELPPFLIERIKNASDEELEQIRTRMRERGWEAAQIEAAIAKARGEGR